MSRESRDCQENNISLTLSHYRCLVYEINPQYIWNKKLFLFLVKSFLNHDDRIVGFRYGVTKSLGKTAVCSWHQQLTLSAFNTTCTLATHSQNFKFEMSHTPKFTGEESGSYHYTNRALLFQKYPWQTHLLHIVLVEQSEW